MFTTDDEIPDAAAILESLGQLTLAASQAEHLAAQGLYFVLAEEPGSDEGANQLMMSFRSFDALCRLLRVATRCDTPLKDILATATGLAQEKASDGERTMVATHASVAATLADNEYVTKFANQNPDATAERYVNKVKALYERRNQCLHALGFSVTDGVTQLYKATKAGARAVVDPAHLMEPCELLAADELTSLSSAIDAVAIELHYSALGLVLLPAPVQWFRRLGTPFDLAPVLDHYVGLAVAPLDAKIAAAKDLERMLRQKIDAYRSTSARPADSGQQVKPTAE